MHLSRHTRIFRPLWQRRVWIWMAVSVLALPPAWQLAAARDDSRLEEQRRDYAAAQRALAAGDGAGYARVVAGLEDYPLYPYLRFEDLRARLATASVTEVADFLARYEDSPLSRRLRTAWLQRLAEDQRWDAFVDFYAGEQTAELQCYWLHARRVSGADEVRPEEVDALWRVGRPQPQACDPVFDAWRRDGHLTAERVWARIRLAVDDGQWTLVQYLSRFLSAADREWVARWKEVDRDPSGALPQPQLGNDTAMARTIVRHGIGRLAREDARAARQLWMRMQGSYSFGPREAAAVARDIALHGAYQDIPEALEWLAEPAVAGDEQAAPWRARLAVRQANWPALVEAVAALPPAPRGEDEWRYWEARALERVGRAADARERYAQLARSRSYYGFLAADRAGVAYAMEHAPIAATEEELRSLAARPALVRAHELYTIGDTLNARREWEQTLEQFDQRGLQLAAVLARQWGWHDRAIAAAARGGHLDDLDLRFPVLYRSAVMSRARAVDLDPAWVYGIVRQESAFWVDARSSAGALGLMQLMPGTADQTARQLGLALKDSSDVLAPDTNIRLGTAYLRKVLDGLGGHQVLATAAYNAGPQRVRRWLPRHGKLAADEWVERVPFAETRSYIKQVMAYTAIYGQRLGLKGTPLKLRMSDVSAGSG
jgi:soluble lytic murein transglycosylase